MKTIIKKKYFFCTIFLLLFNFLSPAIFKNTNNSMLKHTNNKKDTDHNFFLKNNKISLFKTVAISLFGGFFASFLHKIKKPNQGFADYIKTFFLAGSATFIAKSFFPLFSKTKNNEENFTLSYSCEEKILLLNKAFEMFKGKNLKVFNDKETVRKLKKVFFESPPKKVILELDIFELSFFDSPKDGFFCIFILKKGKKEEEEEVGVKFFLSNNENKKDICFTHKDSITNIKEKLKGNPLSIYKNKNLHQGKNVPIPNEKKKINQDYSDNINNNIVFQNENLKEKKNPFLLRYEGDIEVEKLNEPSEDGISIKYFYNESNREIYFNCVIDLNRKKKYCIYSSESNWQVINVLFHTSGSQSKFFTFNEDDNESVSKDLYDAIIWEIENSEFTKNDKKYLKKFKKIVFVDENKQLPNCVKRKTSKEKSLNDFSSSSKNNFNKFKFTNKDNYNLAELDEIEKFHEIEVYKDKCKQNNLKYDFEDIKKKIFSDFKSEIVPKEERSPFCGDKQELDYFYFFTLSDEDSLNIIPYPRSFLIAYLYVNSFKKKLRLEEKSCYFDVFAPEKEFNTLNKKDINPGHIYPNRYHIPFKESNVNGFRGCETLDFYIKIKRDEDFYYAYPYNLDIFNFLINSILYAKNKEYERYVTVIFLSDKNNGTAHFYQIFIDFKSKKIFIGNSSWNKQKNLSLFNEYLVLASLIKYKLISLDKEFIEYRVPLVPYFATQFYQMGCGLSSLANCIFYALGGEDFLNYCNNKIIHEEKIFLLRVEDQFVYFYNKFIEEQKKNILFVPHNSNTRRHFEEKESNGNLSQLNCRDVIANFYYKEDMKEELSKIIEEKRINNDSFNENISLKATSNNNLILEEEPLDELKKIIREIKSFNKTEVVISKKINNFISGKKSLYLNELESFIFDDASNKFKKTLILIYKNKEGYIKIYEFNLNKTSQKFIITEIKGNQSKKEYIEKKLKENSVDLNNVDILEELIYDQFILEDNKDNFIFKDALFEDYFKFKFLYSATNFLFLKNEDDIIIIFEEEEVFHFFTLEKEEAKNKISLTIEKIKLLQETEKKDLSIVKRELNSFKNEKNFSSLAIKFTDKIIKYLDSKGIKDSTDFKIEKNKKEDFIKDEKYLASSSSSNLNFSGLEKEIIEKVEEKYNLIMEKIKNFFCLKNKEKNNFIELSNSIKEDLTFIKEKFNIYKRRKDRKKLMFYILSLYNLIVNNKLDESEVLNEEQIKKIGAINYIETDDWV